MQDPFTQLRELLDSYLYAMYLMNVDVLYQEIQELISPFNNTRKIFEDRFV